MRPLVSHGWTLEKGQVVMAIATPCSIEAMDQGDEKFCHILSNTLSRKDT